MRIYVAGPYTIGDQALNVRRAIVVATQLLDAGHAPYVPHLTHFWHLLRPRQYETWLKLDFEWLAQADMLLRLQGKSAGADREVAEAERLKIPVVYSLDAILGYGEGHE